MELLELYTTFFRIGLFTFGGGLAMLPMLKYELCETKKWITEERLLEIYAIGQCTPGIIAVNTATYVGYIRKKIMGGIVATLGMVSPSIVIVSVIALFLRSFMDNPIIQHALMGIRGAVCALMINTVYSLMKKSLVSPSTVAICAAAVALGFFTSTPMILIIVGAGIFGVIFKVVIGGAKK